MSNNQLYDIQVKEILEGVDWNDFSEYEDPKEIPRLLSGVVSSDRSTRDECWSDLWSTVYPGKEVYDATPIVTELLLDLLALDGTPAKNEFLKQLYSWIPFSEYSEGLTNENMGRQFDAKETMEIAGLILDSFDLFAALLKHEESAVRIEAAFVLSLLGCYGESAAGELEDAAEFDSAEMVCVAALSAIGMLKTSRSLWLLKRLALQHDSDLIRLSAALAWILIDVASADEAINIVLERATPPANEFQVLVHMESGFRSTAASYAVWKLRDERAEIAIKLKNSLKQSPDTEIQDWWAIRSME